MLWTSIFTYDRVTRLGLGNYYYQNDANPNDWGEHRLHFENREVRGVDRNVGGGKGRSAPDPLGSRLNIGYGYVFL